ncbi:sulfate/molybdate ABC transporter ATP-binding protein [Rhodococcoides corynebacterioides]|uniref:ATP-binding cassette domain-containing protein n=1 Tax=Rhodococcoides corynebacterioides TaxID=53972 RepID=A0ABS7P6Z2_9NOCA|nr:ATP-binding cassette domain-containing protein [Rhodococcus corynebacterioides]MBY6368173.1 ATP-binding cassette domain-containing protein [Rhodococcus corynebacterioides]MBY6409016.1 ATP-binding cassette domain-containing protein [Rhodococcus corynebacterioides]
MTDGRVVDDDRAVVVSARVAARRLDVSITAPSGSVLALLGPNGAGKSTVLAVVAGLVRPDDGTVRVGSRTLTDTGARVHVPPHRRGVAVLAQDPLLFPHLTVRENVAFAPRVRHDRRRARDIADDWLDRVDARDLAGRLPRHLSGGQAQRVALARALAADPDVLLLDEPFAAMDADATPTLRRVLREVLRASRCTTLMVTHDRVDALSLADDVVVLGDGRVVEDGPAASVLATPRSPFAAALAGTTLIHGVFGDGDHLVTDDGGEVHGVAVDHPGAGRPGLASIAPATVAVFAVRPVGSPRNVIAARIDHVDAAGSGVRVTARTPLGALAADITSAAATDLDLRPGTEVFLAVKATEVRLYPARR